LPQSNSGFSEKSLGEGVEPNSLPDEALMFCVSVAKEIICVAHGMNHPSAATRFAQFVKFWKAIFVVRGVKTGDQKF
jgi:hypothetical protein